MFCEEAETMESPYLGKSNPAMRRIRSLRRNRAAREDENVFLAEGIHLCQEALSHGADIESACFTDRLLGSEEGRTLHDQMRRAGFPLAETSEDGMNSIQDARSPQPVMIIARRNDPEFEALWQPHPAVIVVACQVQDPGNLGAMLRTADAAGGTGFAALGNGADLYHPRAVRSTMGSIFQLPALSLSDETGFLEALRKQGICLAGAVLEDGVPPDQVDWSGPFALFLGPERGGLPKSIGERLDTRIRIPMRPGVDSLSVGAATAAILFEAERQRRI
jgi:TrmH family RNA methyltransferase